MIGILKFSFLEKVVTDTGPSPVARGVEILGILDGYGDQLCLLLS